MLRNPERIVIVAGAVFLLTLVGFRVSTVWDDSREIAAKTADARALEAQVEKHNFPPPERKVEEQSGRVLKAWEELPPAEPFTEWDFYLKPGRRQ